MRPITFPEANRTYTAPAGEEERVYPLVAHFDPSVPQVTECWRPSLRERLSILIFGRVWVRFLALSPQPVALDGKRTIFGPAEQPDEREGGA